MRALSHHDDDAFPRKKKKITTQKLVIRLFLISTELGSFLYGILLKAIEFLVPFVLTYSDPQFVFFFIPRNLYRFSLGEQSNLLSSRFWCLLKKKAFGG